MFLYLSRKLGWTFALIFGAIAVGLYMYPNTAHPVVGAMASVGDRAATNLLNVLRTILS
jgi:hypothetical protein